MPVPIATDDIVATPAQARANARPPLLILAPLRSFLREHGLGAGEIRPSPIGEGHSNVTYLIAREQGPDLILRRPPRPPLPPSAHDVLREARLLSALGPTAARVPKVLAVCADPDLIGAPFYVMERVAGNPIVSELPTALDTPTERPRIADELIDALVEIHAVDWIEAGLEGFGRPTGYLERQIRRFTSLWEVNKTRDVPAVQRVGAWLSEHLPNPTPPTSATIVHGDYRLGNVIFDGSAPARLVTVLDWEMATIGDPLADLGYLCMMWTEASDPRGGLRESVGSVTRAEGFPTRDQLISRYERRSGRQMGDIRWYQVLALWKMVVFMEGNYRRAICGATDDPYLKAFGDDVVGLAHLAEQAISTAG